MPVLRQIQGETAVESFTGFARISTKNMSETGFFHLRDGNPHIYCAGYEIINALILFVRIMCHIVTGIVFLSHRAQERCEIENKGFYVIFFSLLPPCLV